MCNTINDCRVVQKENCGNVGKYKCVEYTEAALYIVRQLKNCRIILIEDVYKYEYTGTALFDGESARNRRKCRVVLGNLGSCCVNELLPLEARD